jgi:hypothetical protein
LVGLLLVAAVGLFRGSRFRPGSVPSRRAGLVGRVGPPSSLSRAHWRWAPPAGERGEPAVRRGAVYGLCAFDSFVYLHLEFRFFVQINGVK